MPRGRPPKNKKEAFTGRLVIQTPDAPLPKGDDVNVLFRPSPGNQTLALTTPADEILTGGAKSGGKSLIGRAWILKGNPDKPLDDPNDKYKANVSYVFHPEYRALVVRRTYQEMMDWLDKAQDFYTNSGLPPEYRAVWKTDPKYFEWPSGARCYLSHLSDFDSAKIQKGRAVLHRLLIEELTESIVEMDEYWKLISCLRSHKYTPELKVQVMATTNFEGPGLDWVQGHWLYDPKTGKRHPDGEIMEVPVTSPLSGKTAIKTRIFIPFRLTDNPAMSADYEFQLAQLPEHLRSAYLMGNPEGMNGSQFFPEFRAEQRESEPKGAVHIIGQEDIEFADWEPTIAAFDWGNVHKAVMLVGTEKAIGPWTGRFVVRDELIMRRETDVAMGMKMARFLAPYLCENQPAIMIGVPPEIYSKYIAASPMESIIGRLKTGVEMVFGSDATYVLRTEEMDYMRQLSLQQGMKILFRPVANQRVHGWGIMREMMDWSGLREEKKKFDVDYGLRLASQDSALFLKYVTQLRELEEGNAVPRLLILRGRCPELVAGIKRAVFGIGEDMLKVDCNVNTGAGGDDAVDAGRYLCVCAQHLRKKEPKDVWLRSQMEMHQKMWGSFGNSQVALDVAIKFNRDWDTKQKGKGPFTPRRGMRSALGLLN